MKNIDLLIHHRKSSKGRVEVWQVWVPGGGTGFKVTVGSNNRSNNNVVFSHRDRDRATSFASDFVDGLKFV